MHILMDKGLRQEDLWPGTRSWAVAQEVDETENLSSHLAFWRTFYPSKDVLVLDEPIDTKDVTAFWAALNITRHTPSSQYDLLRRYWLPQAGKSGSVAWLALTGDGFHGQRQRSWTAMQGNLHLSVGIEANFPAREFSHALTMLPAVCLMDILKPHTLGQQPLGIKWVNDVLVGRRKLAGVLTSARTENGIIKGVVLGFGLNIAQAPQLPPSSFVQGSTCLHDHLGEKTPSLGPLVFDLLDAVSTRMLELQKYGPDRLFQAYKLHSLILGQNIQIWPEDMGGTMSAESDGPPMRQGVVQAINPDLSLILKGHVDPVTSGRLIWIKS